MPKTSRFPSLIDHVGIAVAEMEPALEIYEQLLGQPPAHREVVEKDGIETSLFDLGPTRVELMAPVRPGSAISKFLEQRGPGLHHVAYLVEELSGAIEDLMARGVEMLDSCPRAGAGGRMVAFIHPGETAKVLTELVAPPGYSQGENAKGMYPPDENADLSIVLTDSGIPVPKAYLGPSLQLSAPPGSFPFRRGIRPDGYRSKPWTMRQYAGFGSAADTNARFSALVAAGQTGLSTAFDLPTQMGLDSDDPKARGEVGRSGVAIDSLADMVELVHTLPLDSITISMTINAPAALLLLLLELAAEKEGIPASRLAGTIQNDILKEYAARGTYIFPPGPSMRIFTDTLSYCLKHLPRWNPVSISGYHMREAGATAIQELGFTLANAIAYVEAARSAGMDLGKLLPRLSFFFNVGNDFLEEVAKFRAARELWACTVRDRFGITDPRAQLLRCHAQTGGATLTAQQPLNNVVRVSLQALAATLGGVQSLHTNSYDEALALPSDEAARLALRTQQVIAFESGITRTADPLGGAFAVEALTDSLIEGAMSLMEKVGQLGGAVQAIEQGFYQQEIQDAAYRFQQEVEDHKRTIVGVNAFTDANAAPIPILKISQAAEEAQVARLAERKKRRDQKKVDQLLLEVQRIARTDANLLPAFREALAAEVTVGEICTALRAVFGSYREHVEL